MGTPTSSPSRRTSSATRSTASPGGAPGARGSPIACAIGTNRSGTAAPLNRITCGSRTPLTTPCGRSSNPPAWWLIACVAPRIALVNASPASSAAWAIAHRAAVSSGRSIVRTRLACTSDTACSAWPSVSGPRARDTNASMPWVSASSPVAAFSSSGIVVSSRGSITETSGTSARPMIVIFVWRRVSVTMQNCETSAPVPDVDGA